MSAEHPTYSYTCESCGESVTLVHSEFVRLREGKWGAKVHCDRCSTVPSAYMVKKTLHPKEGLTATGRARPNKREMAYPAVTAELELSPGERMDYGVTMTIREQDTRELDVVVGAGPVISAARSCVARIDSREGTWRVVTISSPATIFADLQGARNVDEGAALPEAALLGRLKRTDLLERPVKPRRSGGLGR